MSVKAEKTREKILDTALRHFLKDGFSGASLRNIVKDAGLTTGAFYKSFTKTFFQNTTSDNLSVSIIVSSILSGKTKWVACS